MDSLTLTHLNAFISERLTTAAVEIFREVEKTLMEYEREISRSNQEIDHLRSLVLWPEVRLHRSAARQLSPRCCDKESSHERLPEKDRVLNLSPEQQVTVHVKEEHDRRTQKRGPPFRQQCDTSLAPHRDLPSHLYRILHVEQTADVKAEPDSEEFLTSPSREAEIQGEINAESRELQNETLKDPLETTNQAQDRSEQDWSPCQEHEDPDPPQVRAERFTSCSPQEETEHGYELPLKSQRSVCDEPHSSCHNQTLRNQMFHTTEEQRKCAEVEVGELSLPARVSQRFYSVHQHCPVALDEYDEHEEGVVNGESVKVHPLTGTRRKKRKNSSLSYKEINSIAAEEDVNDLTQERRHTCPICGKRFKESSHLKEHVRIHTGEKPYQCQQCGMNFRQSGALTLHMRIHTGERPYQCNDCGRRFNRKGDMESHMVTHTGERPHLCMVCGKSYRRKSNLNTHLKIHAEGKKDYTQPL